MSEHKRIINGFEWFPMDKRTGMFGLPMPPRKPETRRPKYWLDAKGAELYFINDSEEVLGFVSTSSGGFQTCDDETMCVLSSNDSYVYKDVMPHEAVKIDEFDMIYDSDFILQEVIRVFSKQDGCLEIYSPPGKGGIGETVLVWDTGEAGKGVMIKKVENLPAVQNDEAGRSN